MKILLVDDHMIVRDGMRRILVDAFDDVEVGEAANAPEAMTEVHRTDWDLVVLDISLPSRNGLDLVKELRALKPRMPVLMMTMYSEDQYALRAFRAGASGYLTKSSRPEDLVVAARKLLDGGKYVSETLAEQLATALTSDAGRPLHEALSDRELEVLRLLAGGMSVKEIGYQLSLSEKTISTYRSRVLEKMNMRTAAQLMRYAIRAELVD